MVSFANLLLQILHLAVNISRVSIVFNQAVEACHHIPCLSLFERHKFFLVNFLVAISFFEIVFMRSFIPLLGSKHN